MKSIYLIPLVILYSCSNTEGNTSEISALNGTWQSICIPITPDPIMQEYTYNNGSYTTNTTFYTDVNCINSTGKTEVGSGAYSFIKNVETVSGLTAIAINRQVVLPVDFQPKSVDTILYIDNDILYFGAHAGDFDLNVINFDYPYTKVN